MKKTLIGILVLCSVFFTAIPCFAASEGNVLIGSDESEEIMQDMDLILDDVDGVGITQEDIEGNMNKIIRDYVDINVFDNNIQSAEEMKEFLSTANYVYILPVFEQKEGDYQLTISKGLPLQEAADLTEEGEKYIEERTGRWFVPAIGVCEEEWDPPLHNYPLEIETFFRCYGIENSETFFVGGQTSNSVITAICFTDEGEKKDDGPYYIAMSEIDPNASSKEEIEGAVYTFEEMKQYVRQEKYGGNGMGAAQSASLPPQLIVLIIVVAAAIILATLAGKLRKQH